MSVQFYPVHASSAPQEGYACETLLEQGSGALNEDALLAQGRLFGVFDGASSLKGDLYRGKSGAWWAAHLARAVFSANDDSLVALADRANRTIAKGMLISEVDTANRLHLWSTSAAVVRLDGDRLDYVQIGDAQILCLYENGTFGLPVHYRNHDRDTLEQWRMLVRMGFDNPRELLHPQIEQVRLQMNRDYGVLNGEAEMRDFLFSGSLPVAGLTHVLLFTDGLHLPSSGSSEVDFAGMVDCFRARGLSGLHRAVRGIERTDPDCSRFPRFKVHDDIAAVAVTINNG